MRNILFSMKSNSALSLFHFLICWLFWKSCRTKLIPLAYNKELKLVLSSILTYLLCHKNWEATDEGKDGKDEKCFSHFIKISWWYVGNSLILLGLILKLEWKRKFLPIFFLIEKVCIIFQQYVVLSYNLFVSEHCKLVNLFGIWTLLRPPFLWVLHRVECLILGCFRFLIKSF